MLIQKLPEKLSSRLYGLSQDSRTVNTDNLLEMQDEEWRNAIFAGLNSDSDQLKACVALIRDEKSTEEQVAEAVDQIGYLCEMTPQCKSLVSMRGVQPIVKIVADSTSDRCRKSALKCLATALPNNPEFQNSVSCSTPVDLWI
jgi:hypothetical protein